MRIADALRQAERRLTAAGVPDADWDAKELLEWAGGPGRSRLPLMSDEPLAEESARRFEDGLRLREKRIPLQQITGRTWFMGLPFAVTDQVLCPRPDTEVLVELAIARAKDVPRPRILDLCCGSGCIGISLAHYLPRAEVVLSDISSEALKLAGRNAALNGLRDRISLAAGDLLDAVITDSGAPLGTFDLICCNPPYIPGDEIGDLMPEVRDHEPRLALDGGPDGLDFYRRLAAELSPLPRRESGAEGRTAPLLLEIGCEQGAAVKEIFEQAGWRRVRIHPDLAGLDRVAECDP